MKNLIDTTTDMQNRSRQDNLRIIGLQEHRDKRKSLDIILQEILQENCPNILHQEGKLGLKESTDHLLH